jgi:hypothetical protein
LYRSLFRASWKNHILFNPYPLKILPLPEWSFSRKGFHNIISISCT